MRAKCSAGKWSSVRGASSIRAPPGQRTVTIAKWPPGLLSGREAKSILAPTLEVRGSQKERIMALEPRDVGMTQPAWGKPAVDGGPPPEMRAGFGKRAVGLIIDGIILSIIEGIVHLALSAAMRGDPGGSSFAVNTLISLAYEVYFWTSRGTTPGGMIMGIRLVNAQGMNPTMGQAIGRFFAAWISAIPFLLGYLWALGEKKRTWHDI